MIPFDGKAGDGAEQIGFRAAILEMLDRLFDSMVACARARSSPSSETKVALPAAASLPTRLPAASSAPL